MGVEDEGETNDDPKELPADYEGREQVSLGEQIAALESSARRGNRAENVAARGANDPGEQEGSGHGSDDDGEPAQSRPVVLVYTCTTAVGACRNNEN